MLQTSKSIRAQCLSCTRKSKIAESQQQKIKTFWGNVQPSSCQEPRWRRNSNCSNIGRVYLCHRLSSSECTHRKCMVFFFRHSKPSQFNYCIDNQPWIAMEMPEHPQKSNQDDYITKLYPLFFCSMLLPTPSIIIPISFFLSRLNWTIALPRYWANTRKNMIQRNSTHTHTRARVSTSSTNICFTGIKACSTDEIIAFGFYDSIHLPELCARLYPS